MTIERAQELVEGNGLKVLVGVLLATPVLMPIASALGTLVGLIR